MKFIHPFVILTFAKFAPNFGAIGNEDKKALDSPSQEPDYKDMFSRRQNDSRAEDPFFLSHFNEALHEDGSPISILEATIRNITKKSQESIEIYTNDTARRHRQSFMLIGKEIRDLIMKGLDPVIVEDELILVNLYKTLQDIFKTQSHRWRTTAMQETDDIQTIGKEILETCEVLDDHIKKEDTKDHWKTGSAGVVEDFLGGEGNIRNSTVIKASKRGKDFTFSALLKRLVTDSKTKTNEELLSAIEIGISLWATAKRMTDVRVKHLPLLSHLRDIVEKAALEIEYLPFEFKSIQTPWPQGTFLARVKYSDANDSVLVGGQKDPIENSKALAEAVKTGLNSAIDLSHIFEVTKTSEKGPHGEPIFVLKDKDGPSEPSSTEDEGASKRLSGNSSAIDPETVDPQMWSEYLHTAAVQSTISEARMQALTDATRIATAIRHKLNRLLDDIEAHMIETFSTTWNLDEEEVTEVRQLKLTTVNILFNSIFASKLEEDAAQKKVLEELHERYKMVEALRIAYSKSGPTYADKLSGGQGLHGVKEYEKASPFSSDDRRYDSQWLQHRENTFGMAPIKCALEMQNDFLTVNDPGTVEAQSCLGVVSQLLEKTSQPVTKTSDYHLDSELSGSDGKGKITDQEGEQQHGAARGQDKTTHEMGTDAGVEEDEAEEDETGTQHQDAEV